MEELENVENSFQLFLISKLAKIKNKKEQMAINKKLNTFLIN